jgi:hypothetical protein
MSRTSETYQNLEKMMADKQFRDLANKTLEIEMRIGGQD